MAWWTIGSCNLFGGLIVGRRKGGGIFNMLFMNFDDIPDRGFVDWFVGGGLVAAAKNHEPSLIYFIYFIKYPTFHSLKEAQRWEC